MDVTKTTTKKKERRAIMLILLFINLLFACPVATTAISTKSTTLYSSFTLLSLSSSSHSTTAFSSSVSKTTDTTTATTCLNAAEGTTSSAAKMTDANVPPRITAAASTVLIGKYIDFSTKSKEEIAAAFVPKTTVGSLSEWVGTYVDIFSPDYDTAEQLPWDMEPSSRRFIDLKKKDTEGDDVDDDDILFMSADLGDGNTWGRRFDPTTLENPEFVTDTSSDSTNEGGSSSTRITDFACMVPSDNIKYNDAQKGALSFKVTLGEAFGCTCIRWTGPYQGKGGTLAGFDIPANDSDNFLVRITEEGQEEKKEVD